MSRILPHRLARPSLVLFVLLTMLLAPAAAAGPLAPDTGDELAGTLAPEALSQPVISYQGSLSDGDGAPISATVQMVFALHSTAEGDARAWGPETQTVTVTNGEFNVLLGSVTPIDTNQLNGDLWLDIAVNGEQLTPRERITEVPYAAEARSLAPGALAKGTLYAKENIFLLSPNDNFYGLNLERTDEANRIHRWAFWHMNEQYSRNSLQLWEYHADSTGKICNGNPADGAVCERRLTMQPGGLLELAGPVDANGASFHDLGQVQVRPGQNFDIAYRQAEDIYIKSAATSGSVYIGFGGNVPLNMSGNSIVGCGALTEANLQTPEELAAGGTDRFETGDVLCWGIDQLELCSTPGDRLVQAVSDASGNPIVIGAEPVKVLGPVQRGDILVASAIPGYAMVNNDPISGSVIAQALADFEGERGIIKAMIRKW